ncbi:vef [Artaxa digramma nucleopolyhedrovirus]|uniref:Vef n=1 Tax=Artaxa digramma nucleopolyhedrovirus TaxID=3070910 RepID=A0AAE6UZQ6_9ABAC|nr:vef [Euproctis digramma nucleopolyhedrovirus]QHB21682.1 vef [Artaxa digramma nucleopolyhedrovirus]
MSNSVHFSLTVEPTTLPKWLHENDRFYGLHHRRVCLNYLCNTNTTIEIHIKNFSQVPLVVMRCLNNSSAFETTVNVNSATPLTFSFPQTYVPYIDNVVGASVAAEIDVTITNFRNVLPVYVHGTTNASDFLTEWAASTATFAHIELDHIVFLTPSTDRSLFTENLFQNLNQFYNNMLTLYDTMIGITDTVTGTSPSISNNYNSTNYKKFFCKADLRGVGVAYYGAFWIAQSSNTIARYLNAYATNWLALHEVGHAYDFTFVNNVPLLSEVWTNILPDRYQFYNMTYEERQRLSWIFGEGDRETVEQSLRSLIDTNTKYVAENYGFRERLLPFGFMMNTSFAETTFKLINKEFRNTRFKNNYYFVFDWWMTLSTDDFLPFLMLMQIFVVSKYMQLAQLNIKNYFTFERSAAKFKRVAYPACRLIKDFNVVDNNYGLRLESNFSLVYPYQINVVRTINVIIVIDDFTQIANESLSVYDGSRLIHQQSIVTNTMSFNLPVGVYTVRVPLGKSIRYRCKFNKSDFSDEGNDCTNLYLFVQIENESDNDDVDVQLLYTRVDKPRVQTHRTGYVLGISNLFSIKFIVNLVQKNIEIIVYRRSVHSYFSEDRYFAVQLYDNNTMRLLSEATVAGIQNDNYYQILSYSVNNRMRIILYDNATRNRFIFMDTKLQTLSNDYVLLENDIVDVNNSLTVSMETQTRNKLAEHVEFIDNHFTMFQFENTVKDEIYLMIQTLPDKQTLMARYNKYLPKYFQDQNNYETAAVEDKSKSVGVIVAVVFIILAVLMFVMMKMVNNKTNAENTATPFAQKPI